jgi:hypothetical protein
MSKKQQHWPNIYDVAAELDPKGDIPVIAEMLAQNHPSDPETPMPMAHPDAFDLREFVFRVAPPAGKRQLRRTEEAVRAVRCGWEKLIFEPFWEKPRSSAMTKEFEGAAHAAQIWVIDFGIRIDYRDHPVGKGLLPAFNRMTDALKAVDDYACTEAEREAWERARLVPDPIAARFEELLTAIATRLKQGPAERLKARAVEQPR